MRRRTTALITIVAAACTFVLPAVAHAAAAEPDVAVDPPAAVQPQAPVDVAPVDDGTAVDGNVDVEGAAPDAEIAETAGVADAGTEVEDTPAVTAVTSSQQVGSGSLPFTGTTSWQLVLLLLVGSLLVTAGITTWSWARSTPEAG